MHVRRTCACLSVGPQQVGAQFVAVVGGLAAVGGLSVPAEGGVDMQVRVQHSLERDLVVQGDVFVLQVLLPDEDSQLGEQSLSRDHFALEEPPRIPPTSPRPRTTPIHVRQLLRLEDVVLQVHTRPVHNEHRARHPFLICSLFKYLILYVHKNVNDFPEFCHLKMLKK